MTVAAIYRKFNQCAVTNRFTGLTMQLWLELYSRVAEQGQSIVIASADLMEALHTNNRQLQRARNLLVAAGCLSVQKTGRNTCYTVLVDGIAVADDNRTNQTAPASAQAETAAGCAAQSDCSLHANASDVIMNGDYHAAITQFLQQLQVQTGQDVTALEQNLLAWCSMRRQHGWTLTAQGLQANLNNLQRHSGGDIARMEQIVTRTLNRKWRGFHSDSAYTQPRGTTLQQHEQKLAHCQNQSQIKNQSQIQNQYPNPYSGVHSSSRSGKSTGRRYDSYNRPRIPKYDTTYVDLDFLTR